MHALGKVTGVLGDAAAKFSFDSEYQEGRKKTSGVYGNVEGAAMVSQMF